MGGQEDTRSDPLTCGKRPSVVEIIGFLERNERSCVEKKQKKGKRASRLGVTKVSIDDIDGYRSSAELSPALRPSDGDLSFPSAPVWRRKVDAVGDESSNLHSDACDSSNTVVISPTKGREGDTGSQTESVGAGRAVEATSSSNSQGDASRSSGRSDGRRASGSALCSVCSENDMGNNAPKTPVWRWMDDVHLPRLGTDREGGSESQSPVMPRQQMRGEQSADNHPLPRDDSLSRSSFNDLQSKLVPSDEEETERCGCKASGDTSVVINTPVRAPGDGVRRFGLPQRRRRAPNNCSTARATGLFGTGGGSQVSVSPLDGHVEFLNAEQSSIGGHHLAFQHNGVFMKESCSHREESFYEMLRPVQEHVARHSTLFASLYASEEAAEEENEGRAMQDGNTPLKGVTASEDGKTRPLSGALGCRFLAECGASRGNSCDSSDGTFVIASSSMKLVRHYVLETYSVRRNYAGVTAACGVKEVGCSDNCLRTSCGALRGVASHPISPKVKNWEFLVRLAPFVPLYHGLYHIRVKATGEIDSVYSGVVAPVAEYKVTDGVSPSCGTSNRSDGGEASDTGTFRQMIVLEDICSGFRHPCVLDLKMGKRQYGLNPPEAKLRSKEHKAAQTTTKLYGVRLAGMRRWCPDKQRYETRSKLAGRLLSLEELRDTIYRFMQRSTRIRQVFRRQIKQLRRAFFQEHVYRFFTSSLLFVYDASDPLASSRVVMVDFAFTYEREELVRGGDADAEQERDVGYIEALETILGMLSETPAESTSAQAVR